MLSEVSDFWVASVTDVVGASLDEDFPLSEEPQPLTQVKHASAANVATNRRNDIAAPITKSRGVKIPQM
ncbi:MAG: hypothetical protein KDB02_11380 [Acidimicrobiales bacterium]|nr:hypothetical protein [Acidimicrobiales bacterium]